MLPHSLRLMDLGERTEAKRPGRTRFSARPVNTLTVKHRGAVILRGDSLTRPSLTHQVLLPLTCCLTDFMHPYGDAQWKVGPVPPLLILRSAPVVQSLQLFFWVFFTL